MSIKAQNSDEALDKFHSLSNEKVVSRATIEYQTADIDAYRARRLCLSSLIAS